jgi:pyruvate kinase
MMNRIASEAETTLRQRGFEEFPSREYQTHAEIVADSAYRAARLANAAGIVVFSASGTSARLIAKFRPPVPIYVFTPSEQVARQLSIVYGASTILAPDTRSTDEMMSFMERILLEVAGLKVRDSVVFVAGQPIGRPGSTNLLKIHRIGEAR